MSDMNTLDVDRALGQTLRELTARAWHHGNTGAASASEDARVLVEQARSLLEGTSCAICVIPPGQTKVFRLVAATSDRAALRVGEEFPLQGTLTARAIEERHAVESTSVSEETSADAADLIAGEVETLRVVPLVTDEPLEDGRPGLGAVLFYRSGQQPFSEAERLLIDNYCLFVGLALFRAEAQQAARDAQKSQREFTHTVVHELRNPLSVITGYLSLIDSGTYGELPETFKTPLNALSSQAERMTTLIDDLLAAARLENGTMPINVERILLSTLVYDAVQRAQPRVQLSHAEVQIDITTEPLVLADATHIARILDNLISNALLYSEDKPWIKLSISEDQTAIHIEDHGVGVREELREHIFQRFVRDESARIKGSGLGLYISQQLAEANGGSLTLEHTEVGRGSTFKLQLPTA